MNEALMVFNIQERGILNIIRAADIYAIHLLANMRSVDPDKELIARILKGNKISGYNLVATHYNDDDLIQLKEGGHLREIGQQIVVATYTALESYLIAKFVEYYRFVTSSVEPRVIINTLEKIRFRSLEDIKEHFSKILDIHLPSFEIDYSIDPACSFQPKSCWDAITIISKARNEITHQGKSSSYLVSTLMDSWYPFDFSRMWVMLFDANFDFLIYQKHETHLVKEYKKRKEKK